jgi:pilus assembly protein TadC
MTFFLADQLDFSLLWVPISFLVWFAGIFWVMMKGPEAAINKRRKQIDKDVLFAGRFLLVKLNSGKALINALEEASQSYGVANQYFQEIMKDIDLGTPLEEAMENATENCPSDKMKRILFQITNAIEIGIDVSEILESVLDDIAHEQMLEIQAYGEKLSSVALFYMLIAVVGPSLGLAMLIVVSSLISLDLGTRAYTAMAFFMIMLELIFISVFKQIRPDVNI